MFHIFNPWQLLCNKSSIVLTFEYVWRCLRINVCVGVLFCVNVWDQGPPSLLQAFLGLLLHLEWCGQVAVIGWRVITHVGIEAGTAGNIGHTIFTGVAQQWITFGACILPTMLKITYKCCICNTVFYRLSTWVLVLKQRFKGVDGYFANGGIFVKT